MHNYQTITVGEYADIEYTKDYSGLSRYKLPKFILKRRFMKITAQLNKELNPTAVAKNESIRNAILRLMTKNNAQYKALILRVSIAHEHGKGIEKVKELYREILREPYPDDALKAMERIKKAMERNVMRIKRLEGEFNKGTGKSFAHTIASLEKTLAPVTLRDKKLMYLKFYING